MVVVVVCWLCRIRVARAPPPHEPKKSRWFSLAESNTICSFLNRGFFDAPRIYRTKCSEPGREYRAFLCVHLFRTCTGSCPFTIMEVNKGMIMLCFR